MNLHRLISGKCITYKRHRRMRGPKFSALRAILEPLGAHLGGSGAEALGGLGAPFGGSGAVLERSWRPSCGNVIFGRFLNRFWGRLGRPRGGSNGAQSWTQNGAKSKTKKKMRKAVFQARLREVLGPSWSDLRAILAELEAILGRFGVGWGRRNRCFACVL